MSFMLAQALSGGRGPAASPNTRERILARLLAKRAAAHRAGLSELEKQLRNQIRWALPVHKEGTRHDSDEEQG